MIVGQNMDTPKNEQGFSKAYWDQNYSDPSTMDGIANAKEHAKYLSSLLNLEYIDISSIIDLGAGYGNLFKELLREFKPYKAYAIEPSHYAYTKLSQKKLNAVASTKLKIERKSIQEWLSSEQRQWNKFDLAVCNSVFQYLSKADLEASLPILSRRVKYLYLTVPTDKELRRQVAEINFHDTWAYQRSRTWYLKQLRPYFTFVSSRVLESKFYFDEESTFFTDLLYRF